MKEKDKLVIKRTGIIFSVIILLAIFYNTIFMMLKKPRIEEVKIEAFGEALIFYEKGIDTNLSYAKVSYIKELRVDLPLFPPPFVCYPLPNNTNIFLVDGKKLETKIINDLVCWESKASKVIAKYTQKINVDKIATSYLKENNTRIIKLFNPFKFGFKIDLIVDLEKCYGNKTVMIYKNLLPFYSAKYNFHDSILLTPFSGMEYKFVPKS